MFEYINKSTFLGLLPGVVTEDQRLENFLRTEVCSLGFQEPGVNIQACADVQDLHAAFWPLLPLIFVPFLASPPHPYPTPEGLLLSAQSRSPLYLLRRAEAQGPLL